MPTNPYMRCVDIPLISRLRHRRGAVVATDLTFATPINMQPLALGADIVIHSATKYLAGHNDVLAGALAGGGLGGGCGFGGRGGVDSAGGLVLLIHGEWMLHLNIHT